MIKEEGISINKFCKITGISRTEYYRKSEGMKDYKQVEIKRYDNQEIDMRCEELAKKYTFFGHRKIWACLLKEGYKTSKMNVYRILKSKGLNLRPNYKEEIRDRSRARKEYLKKPNKFLELLQLDITYVPIEDYGTYYSINIIDYKTKYPLASLLKETYSTESIIEACEGALEEAKKILHNLPDKIVLLTDNGPSLISARFKKYIMMSPFIHIRTRNHRPETNGCVERFIQTLKYEEVWTKEYSDPIEARVSMEKFIKFYTYERPHQALNYKTPYEALKEELKSCGIPNKIAA